MPENTAPDDTAMARPLARCRCGRSGCAGQWGSGRVGSLLVALLITGHPTPVRSATVPLVPPHDAIQRRTTPGDAGTGDVTAARARLAAAARQGDVERARDAARTLLQAGSAAAVDALVEAGLLCDRPAVEEAVREELARCVAGEGFARLCELANGHADFRVRGQLVEVLALRRSDDAFRSVLNALFDPRHDVIIAAIDGLRGKDDLRAIPYLIQALQYHEGRGWGEGVVAHGIRDILQRTTGEEFVDGDDWKRFWDRHGKGFRRPRKGGRSARGPGAGQTGVGPLRRKMPRFFGLELRSQRVLFVLDTSSSMAEADPGPGDPPERTRLARLRRELHRMVDALPAGTKFSVISFSDGVRKLSGSLLEANESNKRRARKFVDGFRAEGNTWTDSALQAAFGFADVRTIFLLSDGAPVRDGVVIHVPDILDWLDRHNRFRRIRIHTVGFSGTQDSIGDFLREVARRHHGVYRELP